MGWVQAGFGMSAVMGLFMAANAVRAARQPERFAAYMGLPLAPAPAGFVHVYAVRAGFLAVLAAVLLARRDAAGLAVLAGCAVVMPLGDAWLTWRAGAPAATVARHLGIAVFLAVACWALGQEGRSVLF